MKLLVIGINHKTAPIALREQLAFSDAELPIAFAQLKQYTDGCVILSTCNRTEIYALVADNLAHQANHQASHHASHHLNHHNSPEVLMTMASEQIKAWLADYKSISLEELEPYLYIHRDNQAITHWIRVASGLDSMILGEPQILGQIKQAVNKSVQHDGMSNKLSWVVDQVFTSAKQVRHDTQVGSQAVTLGFATAKLATQIFDNVAECCLLVVASGEMNRLVSSHIVGMGIGQVMICNRNQQRAQQLADELRKISPTCQIEVKALSELAECLPNADIVSSCSGSMQALIDFKTTKQAIKKRRYRSMLMVDLAVPRDIEEKVGQLDEVYLYSIDDLQHVIEGNLEQRRQAAVDAELLVSHLVVEIERRFQVKQVGGDIQAYRELAMAQADRLLAEALAQLQLIQLKDSMKDNEEVVEVVMSELTRKLTQTLIHSPSKLMRKVASEGDNETLDMVVETLTDYRSSAKTKAFMNKALMNKALTNRKGR